MAQGQTPRVVAFNVPPEEIRAEMERVLASHEFRSSKRSEEFLRYVVDNTLNGHADTLRERTIGIEVFGRSASYDPSDDATVRVKAGEVRKRLGLYYAGDGRNDSLRIDLPAGTYVPEFRRVDSGTTPAEAKPEAVTAGHPGITVAVHPRWSGIRWPVSAAVAAAVLLAVAAGFVLFRKPFVNPTLEQFWGPVLEGNAPVSLCAAFVPDVYALKGAPVGERRSQPGDFVLVPDQFVGGGDLIAVSRLSALLTRLNRPYRVRIGGEVSLHDLQSAPAILVGYSYTRWREISRELRFFIDAGHRPIGVMDNGSPTRWMLPDLPTDRHTDEDYAIVTRVFHPDTHTIVVELAGITQYGTDAAADLVTNPDLLTEALRGAPAGWYKKNLQLVLHVKVISGSPTSPRVVATHLW